MAGLKQEIEEVGLTCQTLLDSCSPTTAVISRRGIAQVIDYLRDLKAKGNFPPDDLKYARAERIFGKQKNIQRHRTRSAVVTADVLPPLCEVAELRQLEEILENRHDPQTD
uniref:Uncharacterized protein n=1 Tax=Trichogramma kaykai TaxID=54128 RepID=A0ABD2WI55_9HYME